MLNPEFWKGKRVFVTGHTGFKGSWLCLWLNHLGAQVSGYALPPPTDPSLFEMAKVADLIDSHNGNVHDLASLEAAMKAAQPEIVIHMAAQSLVRYSYDQPVETFTTNVLGTVHLLDAVRRAPSVRAVVVVTSDKCYFNEEWVWGYREDSRLGGHDPYSASKGCAELVVTAYQNSFFSAERNPGCAAVGSARAGNVIGGGDWAVDRLLPDFFRARERGQPVEVRHPDAIRPWQHVLEPLSGYLRLAERLVEHGPTASGAWNFGPADEDARPVRWILDYLSARVPGTRWQAEPGPQVHEAHHLKLDSSKARTQLGWAPVWTLASALDRTIEWHEAWRERLDMRRLCLAQIEARQPAGQG